MKIVLEITKTASGAIIAGQIIDDDGQSTAITPDVAEGARRAGMVARGIVEGALSK